MQLSEKFADKSADKKSQIVDLINKGGCHLKDLNLDDRVKKVGLKAGADFGLAHCPERYNPGDSGHTIADVVGVIGAITSQ